MGKKVSTLTNKLMQTEMLKENTPPYNKPVWPVRKASGTSHHHVDYCKLGSVAVLLTPVVPVIMMVTESTVPVVCSTGHCNAFFGLHCDWMIRGYLPLWSSECNTCSPVCCKVLWGTLWFHWLTGWLNSHQRSLGTIKWWHYSDRRTKGSVLSLFYGQPSTCATTVGSLTLRRISSQLPRYSSGEPYKLVPR